MTTGDFGIQREMMELLIELDLDEGSYQQVRRRIQTLGQIQNEQDRRAAASRIRDDAILAQQQKRNAQSMDSLRRQAEQRVDARQRRRERHAQRTGIPVGVNPGEWNEYRGYVAEARQDANRQIRRNQIRRAQQQRTGIWPSNIPENQQDYMGLRPDMPRSGREHEIQRRAITQLRNPSAFPQGTVIDDARYQAVKTEIASQLRQEDIDKEMRRMQRRQPQKQSSRTPTETEKRVQQRQENEARVQRRDLKKNSEYLQKLQNTSFRDWDKEQRRRRQEEDKQNKRQQAEERQKENYRRQLQNNSFRDWSKQEDRRIQNTQDKRSNTQRRDLRKNSEYLQQLQNNSFRDWSREQSKRERDEKKQNQKRKAEENRHEGYRRQLRNTSFRDWSKQEDQRLKDEYNSRRALDSQRSRELWRSHTARLREEDRSMRDMDRRREQNRRKAQRGLYGGVIGAGAGLAAGFYGAHHLLQEQGREATQLLGTSMALDIPIKDLQQIMYVARVMGLYFGPAELADAQNKMIEIQQELREFEAGEKPISDLRIGARKLAEYSVPASEARMANMLPIMEMFAQAWKQGDTEIMAALNNMFEEQVGKRVGIVATMIGTGEWQKLLAADFLNPEEIEAISQVYREMIRVIHEAEVAMQQFLVNNRGDISHFLSDLRAMVHLLGETAGGFNVLMPIIKHLIPILSGLVAMMAVYAVKTWGAAWATAALAAASGQWHNLAAFAAIGIAAGLFTHFMLQKTKDESEVKAQPATEASQMEIKKAVEDKNTKIEGQLENILCIARNAAAGGDTSTSSPISPLRPPTEGYKPGQMPAGVMANPDSWEFIDGKWQRAGKWRFSDLGKWFNSVENKPTFIGGFAPLNLSMESSANPAFDTYTPMMQEALVAAGISDEQGRTIHKGGTVVYGDLNVNVEEPTQMDTAISEAEAMMNNTE